ncbi:MAG: hypothetical protein GWN67_20485 [Phycisphaerae bacterium]|nr:hypothetical protein [Fodinibius sp.]NIU58673.1 hypothetical protein [Phycisphaerae bacterium]NIV16162.1 hypothetical protein [Fodinibius sp.]NIW94959.1 hypothetical protein [Phycisphaerae bacterium]NIY30143.1 hypothetical protein [Fodinibius sp.]
MAIGQETMSSLFQRLYEDYAKGEKERTQRYESGLGDLAQMTGLFGPGYGAGMEKEAIAGATQSLIGRGLGGTTRPGAVSGGLKARFEDMRRGRLAGALSRVAEYKRTAPESTATAGVLSHLATGGFGAGLSAEKLDLAQQTALMQGVPVGGGRVYGRTFGASSFPDMFSIPGEYGFGGSGVPAVNFSDPAKSGGTQSISGMLPTTKSTTQPASTPTQQADQTTTGNSWEEFYNSPGQKGKWEKYKGSWYRKSDLRK